VQHGTLIETGRGSSDIGRGHEADPRFPASGHQGDFSVATTSRRQIADTRLKEAREGETLLKPHASRLQPLAGRAIGSKQALAAIRRQQQVGARRVAPHCGHDPFATMSEAKPPLRDGTRRTLDQCTK
jgi:hypothetical protein